MKRFTETDKWEDAWFLELKPLEKLLWFFILDKCDNAGFFELNLILCKVFTGMSEPQVLGAIKGLNRGLIGAKTENLYFVKNFIRHQKNGDLNPDNNAHKQIIRLIDSKKHHFDQDLGAVLGLNRPIGIGKGKGKGKEGDARGRNFTPPTIEELTEYSNGYAKKSGKEKINCESWMDFYQSKGWMIGKNKMKDWKAAVRQWHTRQASEKPQEKDELAGYVL